MDFPDISTFNSELHHIVAQLRLCGEELIEPKLITKTLSTFPIASAVLTQQYHNMKFRTHAKLMSFLLLAEKEHQILLKNIEARLAQDTSTVETHAVEIGLKQKHKQRHQTCRQVPPRDKSRNPSQSQSQSQLQNRHQPKSRGQSNEGRSPPNDQNSQTCHKCGRTGHIARNCRASQYVVSIYKELQDLKSRPVPREAHSLDIQALDPKLENYLMSTSRMAHDGLDTALLDSATTHSILRQSKYFQFEDCNLTWQICELTTIAGKRNFKFREGLAQLLLLRGTPLTLEKAMYAHAAPRNLISYKDLRA